MRRITIACLGLCMALVARDAEATYSISAVDEQEMLVGGAGVSCVGALEVSVIQGLVPGVGVVHAQALLNPAGRDQAVSMLGMGSSASEIIAAIADPGFDFAYQERQYAVVRLPDDAAAFTGTQNGDYASHQYGTIGPHRYTVQGNILTSENVLSGAKEGFENAFACDMAERLILALEGGAMNGEGDSRCTDDGIPADSGFIRIVDAQGEDVIFIEVTNTAPESPVTLLRAEYEAWRVDNPCPDLPGGADEDSGEVTGAEGDEGEVSSGGDGDGAAEATGASSDGVDAESGSSSTGASGDAGGETTSGPGASDEGTESRGCACDAKSNAGATGGLALLLLAGMRRRRSSRQT